MALTIHEILAAKDDETKTVEIPEWGGEVILKRLSAKELLEHHKSMTPETTDLEMSMRMLKYSLVDEKGDYIVKNDQQLDDLAGKNKGVIDRLLQEMLKMNKIITSEEIDKTAKNS